MSDSTIDRLVGEVVKRVNPLRIVLFGSAARDEAGEQSDIDLLVVMPDGVHRRRTAQKLYREIKGLRVPFDIVVATVQDLEKHKDNDGLIYKNALKEGIEVYGQNQAHLKNSRTSCESYSNSIAPISTLAFTA